MSPIIKPIGLVPFGKVPDIIPKAICATVLGYLNIDTDIFLPQEYPCGAYDKERLQYNAGIFLERLEALPFTGYEKIIGVLDADLFVPILTFVFGEARRGGKCALVSLYRLGKNPDGTFPSETLFLERSTKVALHELGHLFNLVHCADEHCLMHFSGGIQDLDKVPPYFCRYCSVFLKDAFSLAQKKIQNPVD